MSKADAYTAFFGRFQEMYNAANPLRSLTGKPSHKNWIQVRPVAYPPTTAYHAGFTTEGRFRVEITFQGSDRALNKRAFDFLVRRREQIEASLGQSLEWERLDGNDRSQISLYFPSPASVLEDDESLGSYINWAVATLPEFQRVLDSNLSDFRA